MNEPQTIEPEMELVANGLCDLCDTDGVAVAEAEDTWVGMKTTICESCARKIVALFPAPRPPGEEPTT